MRKTALLPLALVLGLFLPTAGVSQTTGQTVVADSGVQPQLAAALVIEQFLRATNAQDLDTMAKLFGTKDGSITKRDPRANVERRMHAIASILEHQDFAVGNTHIVPGRSGEATGVMVRMTINKRVYEVPWTLVQTRDGAWLIEQIDIEKITNRL